MKVLLYVGKPDGQVLTESYDKLIDVNNVNSIDQASVTYLDMQQCLDYVPNRELLLQIAVSKLRKKGRILVFGLDLFAINNEIYIKNLDTKTASIVLYSGRASISSLADTRDFLAQNPALKINSTRLEGLEYFIMATRNE